MNARGFTLLETTVYLALFSMLLFGALPAAYQLMRDADRVNRIADAQDDAAFIDRKIYWALSAATSATAPATDVLAVTRDGGDTVTFSGASATMTVARDDSPPVPLSSTGIPVTDVAFAVLPPDDTSATASVTAHFVIDGTPFSFRYALPVVGAYPDACARP